MKHHVEKVKRVFSHSPKFFAFVKKHAVLLTLLLVLVLSFMPNNNGELPWGGMWMRMQVKDLPVADSAASSSVENYIDQQIQSIARQQYPNLPESNRQKVINDLKIKFSEENKAQLDSEKQRLADEIRAHYSYEVDGRQFLYMPDIDPYYYLRYARNIVEKGHKYDVLKDGKPWDNHMIAPIGTSADASWHPEVFALMHRIHKVFDSGVTLMQSANYFPIVFILLSIIFAFLIGNKLAGPVGGFFSATVLSVLPAIMGRTPWGHGDTDAYQIFFPVLVIWLLCEALAAKSLKKQLLFAGLTGVAFSLFAKLWAAWWYLFNFVGAALLIAVIADVIVYRKLFREGIKNFFSKSNSKQILTVGACIFIVAMFVSIFTIGLSVFFNQAFLAAIQSTTLKEAAQSNLWPNTLTTVAELNPSNFGNIVSSVGGKFAFIIAVIGILLLMVRKDENGKYDFTYSALLIVWFVGTAYMALKGVRFIMLIGPAFAVAFGVGIGLSLRKISDFAKRHLSIPVAVTSVIIILVASFIIVNPSVGYFDLGGPRMVKQSFDAARGSVPIMNDAWHNTLTKIRDESQPDAIVNSWWDFGHHFKFVADRAVSFDGGTQTMPHAHWVGRVLQTDNEDEAVAILRMLDCGANTAYDTAFEKFNDPLLSVQFVKRIIMMDKESARVAVEEAGVSDKILELTHCSPPEDFFIASADMIGKAGVWGHFGLWDFERAETWIKWRSVPESEAVPKMAERFGMSEDEARELYKAAKKLSSEEAANTWISPWPSYANSNPSSCQNKADSLDCGGILINLTSEIAYVNLGQGVAKAGKVIAYQKDGSKQVLETSEGSSELSVVVWPTESGASALAANAPLADSIFTRLFFMNGLGLKHFKPFNAQNQLIGGMIYTFKVDWDGGEVLVPDSLKPKTVVESGARVTLNYIGWTDGGVFDASIPGWQELNVTPDTSFDAVPASPLGFVFGQGKVIPGFEKGIQGMKKGESKVLTIPPEEAYGTDPEAHPLGNKTLKFKVRIESVQ